MANFYISDLHLGHANVIGFDNRPFESVEDINCPVCKTTLKQFKATGKLGCSNCYDAFSNEISKLIGKIAPHNQHKQESLKSIKSTKQTKEDKIVTLEYNLFVEIRKILC